jgi:putative endonuclease
MPRKPTLLSRLKSLWLYLGLPLPRPRRSKRPPTEAALAGAWGEKQAALHLEKHGYRILDRNVRFGPRRELDLVARSPAPSALVFVEVKTRATEALGRPFSAVTAGKRRTLARAAALYLRKLRDKPARVRFDVVEVVGSPDSPAPPVIRHIQNAFTLPGNDRLPV